MSPRIFWFAVLKRLRSMARFAVTLSLVAGVAWAIHYGIRHGLLENEKFRIQTIHLTPNHAIDHRRLIEVAPIDLSRTLFHSSPSAIEDAVLALPEVASVSVRREFPGTLVVDVTAREPYAWISWPERHLLPRNPSHGLLVDQDGFAFPCPPALLNRALQLPVLQLGGDGPTPAAGATVDRSDFRHLLALYQATLAGLPGASQWIDILRQDSAWSIELISRDGTSASFGLGDHPRQVGDLRAALSHAHDRGQQIASIGLIPERNIPVVLRGEALSQPTAPAATVPAVAPDRRSRDLNNLLNR